MQCKPMQVKAANPNARRMPSATQLAGLARLGTARPAWALAVEPTAEKKTDQRLNRKVSQADAYSNSDQSAACVTGRWATTAICRRRMRSTSRRTIWSPGHTPAHACVLIFAALYHWVHVRRRKLWPGLFDAVAAHPLLASLVGQPARRGVRLRI